MKNRSASLTLWANRLLMAAVVALAFAMPALLRWYNSIRILDDGQNRISSAYHQRRDFGECIKQKPELLPVTAVIFL